MPRIFQIDQQLLSNLPQTPTTGLLLGLPPRDDASAAQILSAVPTPPRPPRTQPAVWAAQHAAQLRPMLPTPTCVLGAYTTQQAADVARTAADVAARVAERGVAVVMQPRPNATGFLLKETSVGASGTLRSAQLRPRAALARGIYVVTARLSVEGVSVPAVAADGLEGACAPKLEKLVSVAVVRFDEGPCVLADDDAAPLADAIGVRDSYAPVSTTMLLPIGTPIESDSDDDSYGEATTRNHTPPKGTVQLTGDMQLVAILSSEATLGEALSALKADAVSSLKARLSLLEELDADEDAAPLDVGSRSLPVRAIAMPEPDGARATCLPLSDYMTPDETLADDVTNRFVEMLSWDDDDLRAYSIRQMEQFGVVRDAVHAVSSRAAAPSSVGGEAAQMKSLDVAATAPTTYVVQALILAVIVAIIAVTYKLVS